SANTGSLACNTITAHDTLCCHTMLERVGHGAFAVDVIMIAEDGETTQWRVESREDRGDRARRHTAAAERLHINVVAAEQHEIRCKRGSLVGDGPEADDVVRAGAGMKIGQKGDAQRAMPARPAFDLQTKTADNVALSPADLGKPSLAPEFVVKRRSGDGASQATSRVVPGAFAHGLLHDLTAE